MAGAGAPAATGEAGTAELSAVFVDANAALAAVADELLRIPGMAFAINRQPDVRPDALPNLLRDADVAIIDHTALPEPIARQCRRLRHVVFLGTGARSYMDPEGLAELGVEVHTIKGYGDTAVAEHAIALMWAAARGLAPMDREIRAGEWVRTEGVQLTGKTLGIVGFGSIAAEVARIAQGSGMRVIAWNRTPRECAGVALVPLERLLAESDALQSGQLRHAALDVYEIEPLPAGHPLTTLPSVTLSAHSAFRTPEANRNLIGAAREHCRRIVSEKRAGAA